MLLACSKRSDSGERCGIKKAMKSHLSSSLAFIFSRSFLLRTAPHYLNAWNRLKCYCFALWHRSFSCGRGCLPLYLRRPSSPQKKKKEEEQKQVQEDKNERMKKKNIKLMKLNLNHSRGVNFKIVVFSTNSHFQGCSNVVICILKYIESSSSES